MSLTIVMIVTHFNASDEFDARDSALELKSCSQTNVFFGSKQISKSALFIRGRNTYRHCRALRSMEYCMYKGENVTVKYLILRINVDNNIKSVEMCSLEMNSIFNLLSV